MFQKEDSQVRERSFFSFLIMKALLNSSENLYETIKATHHTLNKGVEPINEPCSHLQSPFICLFWHLFVYILCSFKKLSKTPFLHGNEHFSSNFLCLPHLPLTPTYPYMLSLFPSLSLKQLVGWLLQKQSYLKEELRNYLFSLPTGSHSFQSTPLIPFPLLCLCLSLINTNTHMHTLLCCLNHNYADIFFPFFDL